LKVRKTSNIKRLDVVQRIAENLCNTNFAYEIGNMLLGGACFLSRFPALGDYAPGDEEADKPIEDDAALG